MAFWGASKARPIARVIFIVAQTSLFVKHKLVSAQWLTR